MDRDAFAEVRSYMNRPTLDASEWQTLTPLLVMAYRNDPERYVAQWRPYLEGFRHHFEAHFEDTFVRIDHEHEMERLLELYPFVLVRKELSVSNASDVEKALERKHFQWVGSLDLHVLEALSANMLEAMANSAHTRNIRELHIEQSLTHPASSEDAGDALAKLLALPKLRALELERMSLADVTAFTNSPGLAKLKRLCLSDAFTSEQVEQLLASPHISQLEELRIFGGNNSMSALPLANATQLGALQTLELRGAQRSWTKRPAGIRDRGCEALAGAKHLETLKSLTLVQQEVTDEGTSALLQSPHLTSLTHLDLGHNAIDDAGAVAIANSVSARTLEELDLSYNMLLGAAGLRALAWSENLTSLKKLELAGLRIDATSFALLESTLWARRGCFIGATPTRFRTTDAAELVRELEGRSLEHLVLNLEAPGSDTMKALFDGGVFAEIEHLRLAGDVSDEDIVAFVDAGGLRGLRSLSLSHTNIGDRALRVILAHPHTMSLRELMLGSTQISERALRTFAMAETLTSLENLVLPEVSFEILELIARTPWAKQLEHFGSSSSLDESMCARLLELEDLPDAISGFVEENLRFHAG